ncbi:MULTISPECIES: GtrA family protein [unclassified Rhizobium]|uniref:GtrA family protein n=1 Tax=unclassified Rhizobium TaxID=2613769 RepID=UPI0016214749|nr:MULTISPECIES: GtrA family protein [unclassified Rhizobium]MBB3287297.1 putative flippase GtrA [Rhizobium sp. BK252]MBB3402037.1 putative flippase GtrA [Rhizobium sp. BK289]MBB3414614.1 putative flippase GtrA [Rhizobium sp. BK284]MBB3482503.1 putative flippase GtrA [Rhizobium sp. BK347]MDK4721290.1 GtrA family protein [Rhizobium sp. CNPSo 3968]
MKKLFRFLIAGSVGFIVDAGVLHLLLWFTPFGPFVGRAISIPSALLATWFINRNFTFGRSDRSLAAEGFRYGSVGLTSALLNYALFSSLLMAEPALRPIIALTLASAAATAFSFFGYSRFVFRHRQNS